jgi:hypothetical protein
VNCIHRRFRTLFRLLPFAALLLATGCFQLETLVKLHEDGSATITERYQLSRRMLEFQPAGGGEAVLSSELTKEAVLARMKLMGKGITLEGYELREAEGGGKETVCTFKIPDVNDFQYASPYLALPGYTARCLIKCRTEPVYQSSSYLPTGMLGIRFDPVIIDAAKVKTAEEAVRAAQAQAQDKNFVPKETPPVDLQVYRQLQPVIRDMLQGVRFKLSVEGYAPIRVPQYTPLRNRSSGTYRCDFIDFSDKDLDAGSGNFLDNEEIMLELAQMKFNGPNLTQHLQAYGDNLTLPLFHVAPPGIYHVPPSRFYFDKYFAGKNIGYYNDPKTQKPANFDEIGWKGKSEGK